MADFRFGVYLRLKPDAINSLESESSPYFVEASSHALKLIHPGGHVATYRFRTIFDVNAKTVDVYNVTLKPHVKPFVYGENVLFSGLGVTNSGKTHTISGTESELGLLQRSTDDIFSCLAAEGVLDQEGVEIYVHYRQDLNEKITDLIPDEGQDPTICCPHLVKTLEDVQRYVRLGTERRETATTALNDGSSRSHALFSIILRVPGDKGIRESIFTIVDLAGTEDGEKAKNNTQLQEQANTVNKSIGGLKRLFGCWHEKDKHPERNVHMPFRDFQLTRQLQAHFEKGKLILLLNISTDPVLLKENRNVLDISATAAGVVTKLACPETPGKRQAPSSATKTCNTGTVRHTASGIPQFRDLDKPPVYRPQLDSKLKPPQSTAKRCGTATLGKTPHSIRFAGIKEENGQHGYYESEIRRLQSETNELHNQLDLMKRERDAAVATSIEKEKEYMAERARAAQITELKEMISALSNTSKYASTASNTMSTPTTKKTKSVLTSGTPSNESGRTPFQNLGEQNVTVHHDTDRENMPPPAPRSSAKEMRKASSSAVSEAKKQAQIETDQKISGLEQEIVKLNETITLQNALLQSTLAGRDEKLQDTLGSVLQRLQDLKGFSDRLAVSAAYCNDFKAALTDRDETLCLVRRAARELEKRIEELQRENGQLYEKIAQIHDQYASQAGPADRFSMGSMRSAFLESSLLNNYEQQDAESVGGQDYYEAANYKMEYEDGEGALSDEFAVAAEQKTTSDSEEEEAEDDIGDNEQQIVANSEAEINGSNKKTKYDAEAPPKLGAKLAKDRRQIVMWFQDKDDEKALTMRRGTLTIYEATKIVLKGAPDPGDIITTNGDYGGYYYAMFTDDPKHLLVHLRLQKSNYTGSPLDKNCVVCQWSLVSKSTKKRRKQAAWT